MLLPLRGRRRLGVAVITAAATVVPLSLLSPQWATAAAPPPTASAPTDRTSPLEARRVDRVKVGKIKWSVCNKSGGECAEIRLPLDYDEPNGPTTKVSLGRVKAAKPGQRIGTLFVNPGGPDRSGSDFALYADHLFSREILDRFDIVGVDSRGIGYGDRVKCFKTTQEQRSVLAGLDVPPFPMASTEIKTQIRSARAYAKGCGTIGGPLAASMSTAEVARDMDVVRRALGEKKLNFVGGSYGTFLGQVYANMFPDRVRAIVLDGVLDPVALTTGRNGTGRTVPTGDRRRSAEGAYRMFRELMRRCDTAGASACVFAGSGNSMKKFDVLAKRLKKTPLTTKAGTVSYASMVKTIVDTMYDSAGGPKVATFLQDTYTATDPAVLGARRATAVRRAVASSAALRPTGSQVRSTSRAEDAAKAEDTVRYNYMIDAYYVVTCSDSVDPKRPEDWIAAGKAAYRRVPYFGPLWSWGSIPCAESIWTARDEDRYLGPFTRRTAEPVLVVGNYYDPVTPYSSAVAASKLLPNSRLLSANAWGHTSYFSNACAAAAIDAYLLRGTLPAKGTICTGAQPFEQTATPHRGGAERVRSVQDRAAPPALPSRT